MIFPKPYTHGKKVYPIIGYVSVYDTTPDVDADITAGNAKISIQPVGESVNLFFQNLNFPIAYGYAYALFPKVSPAFPKYFYYAFRTNPLNTSLIVPVVGTPDVFVWEVNDNFVYNGSSYILYTLKGVGNTQSPLAALNQIFYTTSQD